MGNVLRLRKLKWNIKVFIVLWIFVGNEAIKLIEERAGKNQRYISMTELEEKSAYYLKFHKGIGDKEEVKEKVKIMCDRLEELYREHGLDALHDLFENEDDLELAIGKEDVWQNFIGSLIYPRPPPEWAYAKHFMASIASVFIVAVVVATPFSYKYAKRFIKRSNYNIVDAEWRGAESKDPVLVRRMKKRSRRILYKPMLPKFDLKTESPRTSELRLEEVKKNLELKSIKEGLQAIKKRKEWDEVKRKYKLDAIRRRKLFEVDDDDEDDFDEWDNVGKKQESPKCKKKVLDLKLRTFLNGQYRMKLRKKL